MKVIISNRQRIIRTDSRRIRRDSLRALELLGLQRAELSILLASPQKIRALNRQYRGIDQSTDVIAFPLYESPSEFPKDSDFLLGDIVINPLKAQNQARQHGISLKEELRRLLIHGLLHLLAFKHDSPFHRNKMIAKEKTLLGTLEAEDDMI